MRGLSGWRRSTARRRAAPPVRRRQRQSAALRTGIQPDRCACAPRRVVAVRVRRQLAPAHVQGQAGARVALVQRAADVEPGPGLRIVAVATARRARAAASACAARPRVTASRPADSGTRRRIAPGVPGSATGNTPHRPRQSTTTFSDTRDGPATCSAFTERTRTEYVPGRTCQRNDVPRARVRERSSWRTPSRSRSTS